MIYLSLALLFPHDAFSWGKEGHRLINQTAVTLMPAPIDSFFLFYSESLGNLGDAPDMWKKADAQLYNWHFLDLDLLDSYPFKNIPYAYDKALARFGKEKLDKAGILPWAIERSYSNLVRDYKKGRWPAIRDDLIGLAHYIGDGHQPLHTVLNYNGAQTGNPGVHFRFEIELLERYLPEFQQLDKGLLVRPGKKIDAPARYAFTFLIHGFTLADSILQWDIDCKKPRAEYDSFYFECYREKAGTVMTKQLASAASDVAAYWYSAWIEAGRPKLRWK